MRVRDDIFLLMFLLSFCRDLNHNDTIASVLNAQPSPLLSPRLHILTFFPHFPVEFFCLYFLHPGWAFRQKCAWLFAFILLLFCFSGFSLRVRLSTCRVPLASTHPFSLAFMLYLFGQNDADVSNTYS
jgi:hypothetical protein